MRQNLTRFVLGEGGLILISFSIGRFFFLGGMGWTEIRGQRVGEERGGAQGLGWVMVMVMSC